MIKDEILEALPKLSVEERQEIRAKLYELTMNHGLITRKLASGKKRLIEARLDEYV
jgi:hypothetical protein